MRVLLALLVVGIGSVVWLFLAMVGPHAFDPPAVYNIAADIELMVDDRLYLAHAEYSCHVTDQRESIAVGDFHVDMKGDNPYAKLAGASVAVVRGLQPCRWLKEAPPVGTKVKLVAGKDQDGIGMLRGSVWLIDDARVPAMGAVMSLDRLATANGRWRLRSATLTSIATAHPSDGALLAALPFLTSQAGLTGPYLSIAQRMYSIGAVVQHTLCEGNPAPIVPGWVPFGGPVECPKGVGFDTLHAAGIHVDAAFARIDLDPEQSAPLRDQVVLYGPSLVARTGTLPGESMARPGFSWTPQVCVGATCWSTEIGTGRAFTLIDRTRNLTLKIRDWAEQARALLKD